MAFSGDGQRIASAGDDGTLRTWHAATGEALLTLRGHEGWVSSVAFSSDGQRIASAGYDGTLRTWHAATGEWLRGHWASDQGTLRGHAVWSPPGAQAAYPQGRLISASGDAWRLLKWQVWDHPADPGQWTVLPIDAY